jgi:hypothetical protein
MNVLVEAIIVGVGLIAVFWAVEQLNLGLNKWATLFVVGVAFHLIAEVTGVNAAYVKTKV